MLVVSRVKANLLLSPWSKAGLIPYRLGPSISSILPLKPLTAGDVIVSGTPGGVGDRRDPPLYMNKGDIVEVEISQIGKLINPILDEESIIS